MMIFLIILLFTSCNEKEVYVPEEFGETHPSMHMVFPNLDTGKATILELPTGETVLIDCAGTEDFPKLYDVLSQRGIKRIEYVILTSDTLSCTGGLQKLSANFELGDIYISYQMKGINDFRKICQNNSNKDCSLYLVCEGTRIFDFEGVSIDVLSSKIAKTSNGESASVCLYISYNDVSLFYEGDGDYIAEREIVSTMKGSIKSEVIVVPHCGKEYIPSEELLNETRPKFAVIPIYSDVYPRESLVKTLTQFGSEILRTDRDGNISIVTDGKEIDVYKER